MYNAEKENSSVLIVINKLHKVINFDIS